MASIQEEGTSDNISKKKIVDLRVVDLRAELEKRSLDKTGVKVALIERLSKALTSEGKNPENHFFEVSGETTPIKKMLTKRVNKKLTSESETNNSEGAEDFVAEAEDDEKAESEDDEKEELTQENDSKELPDLEDESMEEPYEEAQGPPADEQTDEQDQQSDIVDQKDAVDGQTSPPKPESASVVAPFNVEDTINLDTSCAQKTVDNASLIVHVDDTQSDLDGDLDIAASDLTSKDTNTTSVNEVDDGQVGNSNLTDDNDQGEGLEDEEEEGELEEEEEKRAESNKSVKSAQGDTSPAPRESASLKDTVKASGVKSAASKEKDTSKGASSAVATVSTASTGAGGKEAKEGTKLAQEASTGGATSALTSGNSIAATNVKTKSVAKGKLADKDGKSVIKKQLVVSSRNLWVSGLSTQTRATALKTLFSKYGKVISAKIVTNSKTPGGHCYGFITMSSSEDASKCIQHLHRTELHGKMISVEKTGRDPLTAVRKTENKAAYPTPTGGRRVVERAATAKAGATAAESRRTHKVKSAGGKVIIKVGEHEKAGKGKDESSAAASEEKKEKSKTVVLKENSDSASGQEGTHRERDKSRDKSREKSRDRASSRSESRRGYSSHLRDYRPRVMRTVLRGFRGRVPRGLSMRSRFMKPNFRTPFFIKRPFVTNFKPRTSMLTFQKIKEERLRQRQREREREIREVERHRMSELFRQKDIERKQREESIRLDRERDRLRFEREKLERERADLLRLEREKQKLERERFEREKEELRRHEQIRFDEPRRVPKRPYDARGMKDADPFWDERKKPNRFPEFDHREKERLPYERHDSFDRKGGGTGERFEVRDKPVDSSRDFEMRRDVRRPPPVHEDRGGRGVERGFVRNFPKEDFRSGRGRDFKGRGGRERGGPQRFSRPTGGEEHWKTGGHDRRVHDSPRDRERYADASKGVAGAGSSYGGRSSYAGGGNSARDHTWSSGNQNERGMGKSYGSGGMSGSGAPQWVTDSRKVDTSHNQSWSSQGDRWSHGAGVDQRNSRQQGIQQPMMTSTPQSGMYGGGGSVASGGNVASHSGMNSSYSGDRFMAPIRRY